MKTINIDANAWRQAKKNGWLRLLYEPTAGLPAYAGESKGDQVRLSWRESPPQEWYADYKISSVVKKPNLAVLYLDPLEAGEIHHDITPAPEPPVEKLEPRRGVRKTVKTTMGRRY